MNAFKTLGIGAGCGLAAVAWFSLSPILWSQDAAPPKPPAAPAAADDDAPPPANLNALPLAPRGPAPSEPLYSVPGQLHDAAFARYVDLQLLGQAYAEGNPELLIDVALQLQEGERILHRSHNGLKSADLLNVALRLAVDKNDAASLDRLARIAEKAGDKALAGKVTAAKQLGGKTRAAAPPLPEPTEQLTLEDIAQLEEIAQQLTRARAVGDGDSLRLLQARVKDSPLAKGEYRTYLETQLTEALADLKGDKSEVINLLGELSGASRAISAITLSSAVLNDPNYTGVTRKGVYRNADAYRIDSVTGQISLVEVGGEWVHKNSVRGLRARFGTVYINSGSFMEIQVDATTKFPLLDASGRTIRTKPGKSITVNAAYPEYVQVWERNPTIGGWWRKADIPFEQALNLHLEASDGSVGPAAFKATPIVAVNGEIQLPERTIALTAGSFTWSQLHTMAGGVTFRLILEAGGGDMFVPASTVLGQGVDPAVYARAKAMLGGPTVKNIVAAGGGNLTPKHIVAGGGGNVLARLIGQDGASLAGKILVGPSTNLLVRISEANEKAIAFDLGRSLISNTGVAVVANDGAGFARFIGVGVGSVITPTRVGSGTTTNAYFRNATRLD